ncbi:MAG: hypothetical protein AAF589_02640 [Planctomycetota bacterium]
MNDPAVVGQIHACPKCGGMVMLTPPAEVATPPAAAPAAAVSSPAARAPAAKADTNLAPDFASVSDVGLPLDGSSISMPAAPHGSALNDAQQDEAGLAGAGDLDHAASPFVVAPAESTGRWVGVAVAGGGFSVLLIAGIVAVALRGGGDASDVTAAAGTPVTTPAPIEPPAPEPPSTAVASTTPAPAPSEIEPESPQAEPLPTLPVESAEPSPLAPLPESPPALPKPVEPQASPAPREPEAEEPSPPPMPAPPAFDPLDLDAADLDLILTRDPKPAEQPTEEAAPPPDEAAGLAERLARVEPPASSDAADAVDDRLGGLADAARAVVRRGPTAPPRAPVGDPLAVVIPEIQVADIPFDRACRLLGALAGTPITIDPAALRYAAIDARQSVSLRGENATIGELLVQVSEPLRLEVKPDAAGMVVRRVGADRIRKASYSVDDLLPAGAADATPVIELITSMLPAVESMVSADGAKLTIDGPGYAHMEVAIFCERLRKARGLEPRSRYPQDRLRTRPAMVALAPILARRTTFTFIDFTPLSEVIEHWRRTSRLTILVDWASLADVDLSPTSTIACSINDQPWGEALDAVLGGLGLAWRPIDERTIQITTLVDSQAKRTVEFYSVADADSAKHLADKLTGLAATHDDLAIGVMIVSGSGETHRAALPK